MRNNVRLVYQSRDGLSSVLHNVCPHVIDRETIHDEQLTMNNIRLVYQSRDGLSSVSHNVCPHAIDREAIRDE
ncbi:hypothetical protein [Myroides odoratimimus]|uniref:hypothetical protein n=1 Tax=Myroides odoratimimus TaxID=76832 RepID=UPI0013B430C2|nr:hypothetical protein [Myroides odoratimimus]